MRQRRFFERAFLLGPGLGLALGLAGCGEQAPPSAAVPPATEAPVSRADAIRASTTRVDEARIRAADAEPGNWLAHGRSQDEQRFSPLTGIDRGNFARLGLAWSFETGFGRATRRHRSSSMA